jgi:hypothetical protein
MAKVALSHGNIQVIININYSNTLDTLVILKVPKSCCPGKANSIQAKPLLYPLYRLEPGSRDDSPLYNARWSIETGYRYFKDLLGFDEYPLLSNIGIERYWCIEFLTYNFLEHQHHKWQGDFPLTIGDVVRRIRKDHLGLIAVYAYEQALSQKPLSTVLKELRLTA